MKGSENGEVTIVTTPGHYGHDKLKQQHHSESLKVRRTHSPDCVDADEGIDDGPEALRVTRNSQGHRVVKDSPR
jgi:hypothetical protein